VATGYNAALTIQTFRGYLDTGCQWFNFARCQKTGLFCDFLSLSACHIFLFLWSTLFHVILLLVDHNFLAYIDPRRLKPIGLPGFYQPSSFFSDRMCHSSPFCIIARPSALTHSLQPTAHPSQRTKSTLNHATFAAAAAGRNFATGPFLEAPLILLHSFMSSGP
jgi:hypothetical protein